MDTAKTEELLNKQTVNQTMDIAKKRESQEECKENDSTENNTVESCIEHLKKKIREGPYHIYCVCNRTLNKDFFNIDYK